jgi:predicted ATPase/class 3 adenylate cyclase
VNTTLPAGTVSLLSTDIEGSTRLLEGLGSDYEEVLAQHNALLQDAIAAHGGVVVATEGDAFLAAFSRAHDAVAAALAAQRALVHHVWPGDARVRVRMGVHTGEPSVVGGEYVGVEVHRAQRICAAGHGEQILLSKTTAALASPVDVVSLGEVRLKDLTDPEELFQLLADGLPSSFPPPRSLNRTNLPTQPMRLIGRRAELERALDLLRADVRLVTLTGFAGAGKTRLALQIAAELVDDFADGVFWVPLAPVSRHEVVYDAVCSSLGLPSSEDGLIEHLRRRSTLLLLDNFEHVLGAAPLASEILTTSPGTKILVTTRAALHVAGEVEMEVPPLQEEDGVDLFTERTRAVHPSFEPDETTVAICRRLDDIPLALELAASRLRVLTQAALLERLSRSLDVLTGGAHDLPERQRTLRGALDWSYGLLEPAEQAMLARLSVFAGSATLDQIEQVCVLPGEDPFTAVDLVSSLVDKSLVRFFDPGGMPPHYFMLESVREYAAERLAGLPEANDIGRRHRDAMLALVVELDPINKDASVPRLAMERNNLRGALAWSVTNEPSALETLRLAYMLWRYWSETGAIPECNQWLAAALEHATDTGSEVYGRALDAFALTAAQLGDFTTGRKASEDAIALLEQVGSADSLAWALHRRGTIANDGGELEVARSYLERSAETFRRDENPLGEAWALTELARTEIFDGRAEIAATLLREAVDATQTLGEKVVEGYATGLLGSALGLLGRMDEARPLLERSHTILEEQDARHTRAVVLLHEGPAYRLAGDVEGEARTVEAALGFCLEAGIVGRSAVALEAVARLLDDADHHVEAATLLGTADAVTRKAGITPGPLRLSLREAIVARARDGLGEGPFEAAFTAGAHRSLQESLLLATRLMRDLVTTGGPV